eukprot:8753052-Prorocentrum_lima.AAC.1
MGIARLHADDPSVASSTLRAAGIHANVQRYHPCRAWSRGAATDMLGAIPGHNASEQSASLLGRVAVSLHSTTLAQLGELNRAMAASPGLTPQEADDPMEGQMLAAPA